MATTIDCAKYAPGPLYLLCSLSGRFFPRISTGLDASLHLGGESSVLVLPGLVEPTDTGAVIESGSGLGS